jgi:hypothetical protein
MEGPKLQQPQALSPVVQQDSLIPSLEYAAFFNLLQIVSFYSTRAGTTAERPTGSTGVRWVGMPYFDQTLGKPVFLKFTSSSIWVDGSGAIV